MEAGTFRAVLQFLYESRCELEESMAVNVLEAACRLQCSGLISIIENILVRVVSPGSCLELWEFAERLQLLSLVTASKACVLTCYEKLIGSTEFMEIPANASRQFWQVFTSLGRKLGKDAK